eukprot:1772399-Prymnesium_polylepis.1
MGDHLPWRMPYRVTEEEEEAPRATADREYFSEICAREIGTPAGGYDEARLDAYLKKAATLP